ncbi:MAG TPA: transcription elongation factor GreB [Burkholderiales bacterium]|jgi:transcription elongation factor GreB
MSKTATPSRNRNGNGRHVSGRNGNGRNGSAHGRNGNGRATAAAVAAAPEVKNYMTSQGYARLKTELTKLLDAERPELVKTIQWAASNGDRSENGDYLYGKRRLREIDRRIHYLNKRLDSAEVVDPARRGDSDQIFFGATVTYAYVRGGREERTVTIVGVDEVDVKRGQVSWLSPIARVLLKRRSGDVVTLATPAGEAEIEIIGVRYAASA